MITTGRNNISPTSKNEMLRLIQQFHRVEPAETSTLQSKDAYLHSFVCRGKMRRNKDDV